MKFLCVVLLFCSFSLLAGPAEVKMNEILSLPFEQVLRSVYIPEVKIFPEEPNEIRQEWYGDPFSSTPIDEIVNAAISSNHKFVLFAKNISFYEYLDLVCFLSDKSFCVTNDLLLVKSANKKLSQRDEDKRQEVVLFNKLKNMVVPDVVLRSPATGVDLVEFCYQASFDYSPEEIPNQLKGINFACKDPFLITASASEIIKARNPTPHIHNSWSMSTFYEVISNVCEKTNLKTTVRDNTIIFYPVAVTNIPAVRK